MHRMNLIILGGLSMSVIFTTISNKFIAMSADKQATNMVTGEIKEPVTKIEKWSPSIVVGMTGNFTLGEIIMTTVKNVCSEQGLNNYSLEELADLFAQCYYVATDEYKDMPSSTSVRIVVAGVLSSGKLCAFDILCKDKIADTEIHEGKDMPITIIFDPEDLSADECNKLLRKAMNELKNTNKFSDYLESSHRRAVRYVSKCSKFVGAKSDYIYITSESDSF